MILFALTSLNLFAVQEYCRQLPSYQESLGIPRANHLDRFTIGHYQMNGAISWINEDVEVQPVVYESLMSTVIHFITLAEALGMRTEDWLPTDLKDITPGPIDWKEMCRSLAACAQHILYCKQNGKTIRSSRYNPTLLESHLMSIIRKCIAAIPVDQRLKAINDATTILEKRI